MMLDSSNQLGQAPDLRRYDDAGVAATCSLPLNVEPDEVDRVEGQQGTSLTGRIGKLVLV